MAITRSTRVRPQRALTRQRRILRGWEFSLTGPVDNLVRAFAVHLEACQASGCTPTTVDYYDGRYRQFLTYLKASGQGPPFGLDLLNAEQVRRAALWIKEHSHGSRGGAHSAKMLLATLKTGSAWLADEGYLSSQVDPLARVKRPRVPASARMPFSQEDVRALVGAATETRMGTRDTAIILLLLDTGMRVGGVLSILEQDLDLRERRVKLRLKGGREHVLYFGSGDRRDGGRTVRALSKWLDQRDRLVERWDGSGLRAPRSGGRLFLSFDGWPLTSKGFHAALVNLGKMAGLEGAVFPHRFRHAQPLHSPVLTPSGWRTMGDLKPGDSVVGSDGLSTVILGTYPQGQQEVVRVRFSDGATADCTLDHLWTVRRSLSQCWPRDADHWQVLSTREVIASGGKWHTQVVAPVEFAPSAPLPMDAYTLGALLGDGHFGTTLVLATAKDETEVINRIERALPVGHAVSGVPGRYVLGIGRSRDKPNILLAAARDIGLTGHKASDKAIPPVYLTAPIADRQELLRGLMDTDGYVNRKGCAEFTTISPELAAGVIELVRSLGGIATVKVRRPYQTATHVAYRVGVRTPFTPFHLSAKRARYEGGQRKMPFLRTIIGIEPVGVLESVCVEVSNADGLYVTQDYVVTHNTFATWYLVRNPGDETGLRGILGHLSDDMYRVYTHISAEIVAQRAGRVALSEVWLNPDIGDTPDRQNVQGRLEKANQVPAPPVKDRARNLAAARTRRPVR